MTDMQVQTEEMLADMHWRLVERVAEAMYHDTDERHRWSEASSETKAIYRSNARAAIRVIDS